ncbi:HTH_Tnp_Tc3_2 domain-containing protein [Trichonephila clavipes]|nr:HTH_Tnp_Tc3_2 domain-containing protein [Trichonephila clavipes]
MGKAADLSNFDRGQIVMAQRLGTSIFETAQLMGCSRTTVVSTYAKCMNDSETSSRRHNVGCPHVIQGKGCRRLSRMVKQNRSQTVAQLTAQYNAGPSRIVSEHTVGYGATQQTSHSCAFADQASSPTAPGPWISGRVAWSDESQFVIHHANGHVRICHLPGEQLIPQCTVSQTQASGGSIMLWGTFSGTRGSGRVDHECYRVFEHHCGPVAPLHGLLFFQLEMECSNRTTSHVTRLKLCWSGSRNIMLNFS